jgi:hypothetical protein
MEGRPRIKHELSFAERLAEHAKKIRDRAAILPPGDARDALIEKLERTELAIEISKALSSTNTRGFDAAGAFRLK